MEQITLRELTKSDEIAFRKAILDFPNTNEFEFVPKMVFNIEEAYQKVESLQSYPTLNFLNSLKMLNEFKYGVNLPKGFVPSTILFAFNNRNEIVGRSSIRHELNEYLLKVGGHIGYGVLPKFRQQGFATKILKLTLAYCGKHLNLEKVLLTCDDDNIGSIKTIEKNGGILENTVLIENKNSPLNKIKRRYWITL